MASRTRARLLHHALWALAPATTIAACSGKSTRTVTTDDSAGRGGSGGSGGSATFAGSAGRGGRSGSGAAAGTGGFGMSPGLDGGSGPGPSGGTSGIGGAGSAGNPGTLFPCIPSNAGSATTGACLNGSWHRPLPETCRLPERRTDAAAGAGGEAGLAGAGGATPANPDAECEVDTDCDAAPHGYCVRAGYPSIFTYRCHYACQSDDDCDIDQACACDTQFDVGADSGLSAVIPRCVPADCRLDSQCANGFACFAPAAYDCSGTFGPASYHCQSSNDSCGPPGCNGAQCTYVKDHYECADAPVCPEGR